MLIFLVFSCSLIYKVVFLTRINIRFCPFFLLCSMSIEVDTLNKFAFCIPLLEERIAILIHGI